MANQQPDKLFREKLYDYQRPVSAGAWDRISKNREQKKWWHVAMKAAASFLLLATVSALLLPAFKITEPVSQTPEKSATPSVVEPQVTHRQQEGKTPLAQTEMQQEDRVATVVPKQAEKKSAVNVPKRKPVAQADKQLTFNPTEVPGIDTITSPVYVAVEPANVDETRNEKMTAQAEAKNVKIVFSAEEVNRKYLTKNVEVQATPGSEETSGLKKLLDKAYDLKHNQALLGSLRQKKNEILAMNFMNEKARTQND